MVVSRILFVIWVFLSVGCNSNDKAQLEEIDKQIMATHDEVMPRMGEVLRLRKQIQAKLDSCQTAACSDTLNKLSYALTKADADMMKWMRAYKKPEVNDSALVYLQNQSREIDLVKKQILDGISQAKTYLNNNEN